MITGLPSILTSVSLFPLVLATTSVFPDALGVGVSRSAVIMSLLPSIFAVIAMIFPPGLLGLFLIEQRHAKKHIGDVVTYVVRCVTPMHTLIQLQVVLRILLRRITAIELSGFAALNPIYLLELPPVTLVPFNPSEIENT
jgi:hypothetical protein